MSESTTELQQNKIKEAIKELLKRKGLTYSDLAKLLDCSLPTAKRIMNKEELSLTRLLLICDWLDVSLGQLEEVAERVETQASVLTKEQEDFLAEKPHFLSYYVRLAEGMKPEQIAKENNLSKMANQKYLLGLEKIGLVHTTPGGRVVRHQKGPFLFRPGGRLAKTHFERIIDQSASYFKKHLSDLLFSPSPHPEDMRSRVGYAFKSLMLTEESIQEYVSRIRKLIEETERISEHERRVFDEQKLKELTIVLGYSKLDEPTQGIPVHKDLFGDVIEI